MSFLPDVNMEMPVRMEKFVMAMSCVHHVPWKSAVSVQMPTLRLRLLIEEPVINGVDSALNFKQ